jgi:hypothetical protein
LRLQNPSDDLKGTHDRSNWLLNWFNHLFEKELAIALMAIALMAIYHMCCARNKAREKVMIEDPRITAKKTMFLVEEWMENHAMHTQHGSVMAGQAGRHQMMDGSK